MPAAPLPAQESLRLNTLQLTCLLDTPPEGEFDELAALAADICQTPIALVSLVDHNRQWFKSLIGLDVRETHRNAAFCAHAILNPELLVVEDAMTDLRFQDNPLVQGAPFIRFYAGMPLVTENGQALGTLCVIDLKPRALDERQANALKTLGRQCARLLDLRLKMADLNQVITQSEDFANRLKSSLRKLEQSNQDLEDFAFVASHDLREPLRKIHMFSDLLTQHLGAERDEKTMDYLERLRAAAKRMDMMVGDLLDLARIKSQGGKFEQFSLDQLLENLKSDLEEDLQKLGATLSLEPFGHLEGDPNQIRLLFVNLISNSLKYRKPDAPPQINIRPKSGADHPELWLEVADNGIGFEPQHAETIFTLFKRLHGKESYEGTGIGLALCRRIAQRHGGSIEAMGAPGQGAVFTLRLPRSQGEET